ncbi:hypothetical protein [Phocaeicola dorei]|jgi:hypothetical protein|uniref:hypothetical protein n=1 Tax=Phocaeicola dorei TaxID=357276 RepID=UPI001BDE36CB|nr:hypothetical protein [Phocaeicola dorei]MBT1285879.1 hypothetical protein [Phocaeicola dorei]MBT1289747.1 hypothetical protein [Phocaeicola dorei]
MANYAEMTVYELEQERERIQNEMMACNDDIKIELLAADIEDITDEIESRDPLADE